MPSNIFARAGLVALVFALTTSLVSAAPIASKLSFSPPSNPSLNGPQSDGSGFYLSGRTSTLPLATRLTLQDISTMDNQVQLVRRNSVAQKAKNAFHKVKEGFEKVGHAVATVAKKAVKLVKTVGGLVVKTALKVYSAGLTLVGKLVGAVAPGLKAVGKVMTVAAKGIAAGANKIKTTDKGKFANAMNKLGHTSDVVRNGLDGYVPIRRDLSEEEGAGYQ